MPVRFLIPAIVLAMYCVPCHAADQGQLDASPALFTVLAAINAAGYDANIASAANHPLREAVRRDLAAKNIPCLEELKRFFESHRQRDEAAELSQYISFGLLVDRPTERVSLVSKREKSGKAVVALQRPTIGLDPRRPGSDSLEKAGDAGYVFGEQ